ncbi:MAG: aldehyde dehydrogenase family protein [Planctomycetes bacterium]|nr:aldehyde dehydrogenase family protein [Planctomycetota bacterium]
MTQRFPLFLAGQRHITGAWLAVHDKWTGEVVAEVARADAATVARALAAVHAARPAMAALSAHERIAILHRCAAAARVRSEELARILVAEVGKPVRDARGEVARMADTFTVAAAEVQHLGGELMPLDLSARSQGYTGIWRRVPVGATALITPFNFPLNLAAHKVAPAIAAGCPFVLKPASTTPRSALVLGEILEESGLPPHAFSILPCDAATAAPLVEDDRVALLSFTGSPAVGWELKRRAGRKRITLELGGNAGCIVDEGADLDRAVQRLTLGIHGQSGQSCISVQRVFAHESLYGELRERLVAASRALGVGDPRDENTTVGPLISVADAERLERWVQAAVRAGGQVLCGGRRAGAVLEPTLLEQVPEDQPLCAEEAFGPIAVLAPFRDFAAALAAVNRSRFGLQAGVFTRSLPHALAAWRTLEVGGVVVNDSPTFRADAMPYGGVKESGFGREGPRAAIEEMTEQRLLVLHDPWPEPPHAPGP